MAEPGTAAKGRRVALPELAPSSGPGRAVAYVCGGRPLRFGEHLLTAGVEVPGAADWLRLEAWVGARRVYPVYEGEEYVSYEQFTGMTYQDELAAREVGLIEEELAAEQAVEEVVSTEE